MASLPMTALVEEAVRTMFTVVVDMPLWLARSMLNIDATIFMFSCCFLAVYQVL